MYVVSPRHPQGLRYNRKVYGFGLWSQTGARIDLYEDGEILARRRVFYFDLGPNIRWGRIRTSWRMIEICLHPNPNNNCTEYLAFYILRYVHPPVQAAPDLGPAGPHMGPLNLGYGGGGDMPQSSSGTEEDVAEDGEDEGVENNGHESPNDVFENEHEIRDTSVLVRLRPAWEDLRSYLIAKGRKRFEVYVCTMAERDYALEMWRLLDPGSHLIGSKQLLNRVNCVKPGARKSLLSVFQDRNCHPRMAMVIDDRLKVWEEKDQPRVHVVPAFTPYYAPQAETANAVPVLCVARNVACNVRGGFFKDFDEILLRRLAEHFYEDEVSNLPSVPDVCNYLVSEDASFVPNGNTNAPMIEGITGPEVASRLSQQDNRSVDPKSEKSLPSVLTASIYGPSSFRSVVPSEKPSILGPIQGPEMSNKQRAGYNPPSHGTASSFSSGSQPPVSEARGDEAVHGYGLQKKNLPQAGQLSEQGVQLNQSSLSNKRGPIDGGNANLPQPSLSIGVLQEIGQRCGSKGEYRSILSSSRDWQFSYEVMFTGEKIGIGMGKTRKDAQQQAAENALRSLADKYAAYVISRSETINKEPDNQSSDMENGFLWDSDSDESLVKDVDNSSEVSEMRRSNLTGQQKRGESARRLWW